MNKDKYSVQPKAQILIYPALSNKFDSESFKKFKDVDALTTEGTKRYTQGYAGKPLDNLIVSNNRFIYPVLADVYVFPKTIIISAECDVLMDGQIEFKNNLKSKGIDVTHIIVPGAVHGFMGYGKQFDTEVTQALLDTCKALSK